jgi:plastocyanin
MRLVALAMLSLALGISAAPTAQADPATGVVRGKVTVMKKKLFGGLGPSGDASGVVVYVTGYSAPPPDTVAVLEQENERFQPRILPIVAGQTVSFPNRDRFYHNVFSVSSVEPFDLGQYKSSDPPRAQRFASPGLVPVYCNIHPQMISYVVVLENGAFAVTGEDGAFELRGVHAGQIALNAWLPGAQRVTKELELAPGAELAVDLELAQTQTTPPHTRKDGTPYPPPPSYDE